MLGGSASLPRLRGPGELGEASSKQNSIGAQLAEHCGWSFPWLVCLQSFWQWQQEDQTDDIETRKRSNRPFSNGRSNSLSQPWQCKLDSRSFGGAACQSTSQVAPIWSSPCRQSQRGSPPRTRTASCPSFRVAVAQPFCQSARWDVTTPPWPSHRHPSPSSSY